MSGDDMHGVTLCTVWRHFLWNLLFTWRIRHIVGCVVGLLLVLFTVYMPPYVRMQDRPGDGGTRLLEEDGPSASGKEVTGTAPPFMSIFVVFHHKLHRELYDNLDLPQVRPSPTDVAHRRCALSRPGTEVIFVGTNPSFRKVFDAKTFRSHTVMEWELPGYNARIGSKMNEYGAMNTIYESNLTGGLRTTKIAPSPSSSWVGVFQFDMTLNDYLINTLLNKIKAAQFKEQRSSKNWQLVPRSTKRSARRCCIFFGVTYPSEYLLRNDVGMRLLQEYNSFFGTSRAFSELHPQAVLDMFVVPADVYNRIAPFLAHVMLKVIDGVSFTTPPASNSIISAVPGKRKKSALDVMECALALALGLETQIRFVQIPIRHEKFA